MALPSTNITSLSRASRPRLENSMDGNTLRSTTSAYAFWNTPLFLSPDAPVGLSSESDADAYFQYPIGSVLRTADEIAIFLRKCVPWLNIVSRLPKSEYREPWPLVVVTPMDQYVYQPFTGLAGNPTGLFNKYCVKYIGLPSSQDDIEVQQSESRFWYDFECIIRCIKSAQNENLNGTVSKLGQDVTVKYAEDGPFIYWRELPHIGGMMIISVWEVYRVLVRMS